MSTSDIGARVMERLRELDKSRSPLRVGVPQFEDVDDSCASSKTYWAARMPRSRREEVTGFSRGLRFFGPMVELSRLQREVNRLFTAFVESNNRSSRPSPRGTRASTSWTWREDPDIVRAAGSTPPTSK